MVDVPYHMKQYNARNRAGKVVLHVEVHKDTLVQVLQNYFLLGSEFTKEQLEEAFETWLASAIEIERLAFIYKLQSAHVPDN